MPKKIINIFISCFLVLFSFFYTNKIINMSKDRDPIMIEIKTYENIDVDKSYQIMKKTGRFDKNLLVFKETVQERKIKNNYDDYISLLDEEKNEISMLFILEKIDNILNIFSILDEKNVKATFFLSRDIFDNYFDFVKQIINNGHEVELLSDSYSVYEVNKYNSMIKLVSNDKLSFCINPDKKETILKSCKTSKLYSVTASIRSNPYLYAKKNLKNGLIITFDNSKQNIKELSITINYILQKGKKLVLLKKVLQ